MKQMEKNIGLFKKKTRWKTNEDNTRYVLNTLNNRENHEEHPKTNEMFINIMKIMLQPVKKWRNMLKPVNVQWKSWRTS